MTNDAQSQPVPIETLDWEPFFNSLSIDIIEERQDLAIRHASDGYAQSHHGACMARAAENVARWKLYLPEECVRAMVNDGWHWST